MDRKSNSGKELASAQQDAPRLGWARKSYRVEAIELWQYFLRSYSEPFVEMRIGLGARIDEAALREALEQSCTTLPLIACRFDTSSRIRPRWVPRKGAEREMLRVVEVRDSKEKEKEAMQVFLEPLDIEQGPQLRIVLLREADKDSLHLKINHMLCDGAGCKQYLDTLTALYASIVAGEKPTPPPFCPERSFWPLLRRFTLREKFRAITTPFHLNTRDAMAPYWANPLPFKEGPTRILMASLPAEDFNAMRRAAKAQNFTVNDVFMTALVLAWHRLTGADKLVVPCTMDFRSFVPPQKPLGITNFVGNCPCFVQIAPQATWEDILSQIAEQMRVYKQGVAAIQQFIKLELTAQFIPWRVIEKLLANRFSAYPVTYSNAGIINDDFVQFDKIPLESAVFTSDAFPAPSFPLRLSTFRNSPTFMIGIKGDDAARDFAQDFLNAIVDELIRFGASSPTAS
jgi:NRPS condensation-like uncharacterized protein